MPPPPMIDLLGIRLNAYALVDFDAFTQIVDSVGGVVIDVKRPVRDESYPTPDYGVERLDITVYIRTRMFSQTDLDGRVASWNTGAET